MGGLFFLIAEENSCNIDISVLKSFNKIKFRGSGNLQSNFDIYKTPDIRYTRNAELYYSKKQLNEWKNWYFISGFHRHAVNDLSHDGIQPFVDPIKHKLNKYPELKTRTTTTLLCDGEIYNHLKIKEDFGFGDRDLQSESDVEVILPLYIKHRNEADAIEKVIENLDGEFSFVINDNYTDIYVARDYLGFKNLYYITHENKNIHLFVSEKDSIPDEFGGNGFVCIEFPIGSYWSFKTKEFTKYHNFSPETRFGEVTTVYSNIRELGIEAITKRCKGLDTVAIFLSSGFSSCLIFSILKKLVQNVYVYTIDPDSFTKEFLKNSDNVSVRILDSNTDLYETLFIALKRDKIRVCFSGEGLDELLASPVLSRVDNIDFQRLSISKLENLHTLLLNKIDTQSHKLATTEIRLPWLDKEFVEYILSLPPTMKKPQIYSFPNKYIDKYIIRKSFEETKLLPDYILWNPRKKYVCAK